MAQLDQSNLSANKRITRYFSESFKKAKVEELDKKLTTVRDISKEYSVSETSVYKWIYKFSLMRKKAIRMVVEPESDTAKIKALKQRIADLEQLLGQKQFELDFVNKQMDVAGETYGIDLKKKASGPRSSGSGKTAQNTPTK